MTNTLRNALDRTLLLMRDDVSDVATDEAILAALTGTEIALSAKASDLACHSMQTAYITAALLMARSGHKVYLAAPDVPLIGPQPPLKPGGLISSLNMIGRDLLPDVEFSIGRPRGAIDLEVIFGDGMSNVLAKRIVSVGADIWSAQLCSSKPARWSGTDWPFGGLAAGGVAAGEAFKAAMWKLRYLAKNRGLFEAQFATTDSVDFEVAPHFAPRATDMGRFDFVSAGAITNCVLFALARIPEVTGAARVVDDDQGDVSNLNRNMLMLRSMIQSPKAATLALIDLRGLQLDPVLIRYNDQSASRIGPLAPRVLVGVDDIASRWEIQRAMPGWLGVGATSHWSSMASFHVNGIACAGCLHPTDDQNNAAVPTVAFVSFWAGLLLAAYFVRAAGGESLPLDCQQTYLTPLRPETPWRSPVAKRRDCPVAVHLLTDV